MQSKTGIDQAYELYKQGQVDKHSKQHHRRHKILAVAYIIWMRLAMAVISLTVGLIVLLQTLPVNISVINICGAHVLGVVFTVLTWSLCKMAYREKEKENGTIKVK